METRPCPICDFVASGATTAGVAEALFDHFTSMHTSKFQMQRPVVYHDALLDQFVNMPRVIEK